MTGTTRSGGDNSRRKLIHTTNPEPIPKPAGLAERPSEIWDELIQRLPATILQPIDAYQLETLANLLWQSECLVKRLCDDPGDLKSHRIYLQNCQSINRLSSLFGLSPMDRSRMELEPADDTLDPFLDFLAESRKGYG